MVTQLNGRFFLSSLFTFPGIKKEEGKDRNAKSGSFLIKKFFETNVFL
jgi:hypothetical protein